MNISRSENSVKGILGPRKSVKLSTLGQGGAYLGGLLKPLKAGATYLGKNEKGRTVMALPFQERSAFIQGKFSHRQTLSKHEEGGGGQAKGRPEVIPGELFPHIKKAKSGEDDHRDDFLNHLELGKGEIDASHAVGRDLQAVFEESDAPAKNNRRQKRPGAHVFQVAVPGVGHE